MKVTQSCRTLCNPMDYTVHEILQARILEWVSFPFSRGSSQPRDWTQVSCIAGRFFTSWATRREKQGSMNDWMWTALEGEESKTMPRIWAWLFISVQLLSCVWLSATPWTEIRQAPLSFTISWSLVKFMFIELVMLSNHLILCCLLLLLPSIFPRSRLFSKESALRIMWPKYWSFSFSNSHSDGLGQLGK